MYRPCCLPHMCVWGGGVPQTDSNCQPSRLGLFHKNPTPFPVGQAGSRVGMEVMRSMHLKNQPPTWPTPMPSGMGNEQRAIFPPNSSTQKRKSQDPYTSFLKKKRNQKNHIENTHTHRTEATHQNIKMLPLKLRNFRRLPLPLFHSIKSEPIEKEKKVAT